MAQAFDAGRLRFTGDPFLVAQGVLEKYVWFPFATFSASAGVLAYRTGKPEELWRFRWFDRKGTPLEDAGPVAEFASWDLSPNGHSLAVNMRTARDIWVFDLVRGTNSRLTSGGGGEPSWSPDGRQIAFTIDGESPSVIRRVAANGSGKEELVAQLDRSASVEQWTADGRYLILEADVPGGLGGAAVRRREAISGRDRPV